MADPLRALPAGSDPVRSSTAPAAPPRESGSAESPAFRVLLERLAERAQELETKSRAVDEPAQLAGAVDAARASLEDALSLGDRLLEAYRVERQLDLKPGPGHETVEP